MRLTHYIRACATDIGRSIAARDSTLSREVLSGFVIYLGLVYIFIVTPEILSQAGTQNDPMPGNSILIATVATSALATMAMGFFANLPLAVAPGLEVSTFFTYVLVRGMHLSWREALLAVFISGIVNVVLTYFSFREKIVESIPDGLKAALLLSVGTFISLVAFKVGGVADVSPVNGMAHYFIKDDFRYPTVMLLGAVICFFVNSKFVLPWGIIASVIVCTIFSIVLHIDASQIHHESIHDEYTRTMLSVSGIKFSASISITHLMNFVAGTIILFIIDFIGGLGKIVALTTHTSMQDSNGKVQKLEAALYVDGAATVAGSLLGTSSLIAFVESRLGIEAGARTGIAALVCGALMITGTIYLGAFRIVPAVATSGILLYIGLLLIRSNLDILNIDGTKSANRFAYVVGIAMAAAIAITFQMDWAMFIGFSAYFIKSGGDRWANRGTIWLGIVAGILGVAVIIPIIIKSFSS